MSYLKNLNLSLFNLIYSDDDTWYRKCLIKLLLTNDSLHSIYIHCPFPSIIICIYSRYICNKNYYLFLIGRFNFISLSISMMAVYIRLNIVNVYLLRKTQFDIINLSIYILGLITYKMPTHFRSAISPGNLEVYVKC